MARLAWWRKDRGPTTAETIDLKGFKDHTLSLNPDEYSSKLYGLSVLPDLCQGTGAVILPFRVYDSPKDFSIAHFLQYGFARLLIRTDPKDDSAQTMGFWGSLPRTIITPQTGDTISSMEAEAVQFMKKNRVHKSRRLRFIVHKLRDETDYISHVQTNADLTTKTLDFRVKGLRGGMPEKNPVFRLGPSVSGRMHIGEDGHVAGRDESGLLSKDLMARTCTILDLMIKFAQERGYYGFETSYVTYWDAPDVPEYYDLLFKG